MLRNALWVFIRPLMQLVLNLLNPSIGEEWLREFKKFLRREPCWIKKEDKSFFRLLFSGLPVPATDGTQTFDSCELFEYHVFGFSLEKSRATESTKACLWAVALNGKFKKFSGNLDNKKIKVTWTAHQVIRFCSDHQETLRRLKDLILFELEGGFFASVSFDFEGTIGVRVFKGHGRLDGMVGVVVASLSPYENEIGKFCK